MNNGMSILLLAAGIVFVIGYFIGLAVFSKSENQAVYAVVCGLVAVIVTAGVVFVGCSMAFRGI